MANRYLQAAAKRKGAEDDAYVTYERGRTGGTVRAPASQMVSGVNGTFKGEGGDAVTQRRRKRSVAGASGSSRVTGSVGVGRIGDGKRGYPAGRTVRSTGIRRSS